MNDRIDLPFIGTPGSASASAIPMDISLRVIRTHRNKA